MPGKLVDARIVDFVESDVGYEFDRNILAIRGERSRSECKRGVWIDLAVIPERRRCGHFRCRDAEWRAAHQRRRRTNSASGSAVSARTSQRQSPTARTRLPRHRHNEELSGAVRDRGPHDVRSRTDEALKVLEMMGVLTQRVGDGSYLNRDASSVLSIPSLLWPARPAA